MVRLTHTIDCAEGLHALTSADLATLLRGFDCQVLVSCNSQSADGTDPMALVALGAHRGAALHLLLDGADEALAAAAAKNFLKDRL